jgi:acyl-CoA synthetase (AMP-forming)/AMP-acid ligase II/acyl carrier protein
MTKETAAPIIVQNPEDFTPLLDRENKIPVASYVANWAAKDPTRPALVEGGSQYTYHELNAKANQVAAGLLQFLGANEQPVGILLGKEALAVISTLATLKTGNFYAGLDPTNPKTFTQAICNNLEPAVILTNGLYLQLAKGIAGDKTQVINVEQWLSDMPSTEPRVTVPMDLIAGIYYTSGTTGKSKGVVVDQNALWHRTHATVMTLKYSPSDRTCMPFPVGFGWSTTPLFGTLVTGGTVFLYDFAGKSVLEIADWFLENKITNTPMPASFMKQFLSGLPTDFDSKFPDMRLVFAGGDAIEIDDLQKWQKLFSSKCVLAYGFSSTEGGPLTRTFYRTDTTISEDSLTFGIPAVGVDIIIVDEQGKPVPAGTPGEIAIKSEGKMLGYWRNESLSGKKFIDDPDNPGERLLLTGDMGRLSEQNYLEFSGRKDSKVKIRGYLVDIAQIEETVRRLPAVQDAAVTPYKRKNGELRLAAYLVYGREQVLTNPELKRFLAAELPSHMIPQLICVVDALPRSPSGKVNTYLLPAPSRNRSVLGTAYAPPKKEIELQIASIWQDVLEMDEIGIYDNFFDLGGDSLSALEMALSIETTFSKTVPQSFFADPTISHLQAVILDEGNIHQLNREQSGLESYLRDQRFPLPGEQTRQKPTWMKKLLRREISSKNIERFLDLLVARYIASLPYQKAKKWIVRWSRNRLVRRLLYNRRNVMFSDWLMDINPDHINSPELFQRSMITNLNYRLRLFKSKDGNTDRSSTNVRTQVETLKKSQSKYWSSLARLIEETPPDEFDAHFPVNGLCHLTDAIEEGNGVILLSFHGFMAPLRFLPLKWRLGINIFTISDKPPRSQGQFRETPADLLSAADHASMNAQIALFGQGILQKGGVINIVGDSSDPYGQVYQIKIGNRRYEIQSGFAEMAINTGAKVIPHFGRALPDGRPETIIVPPLKVRKTERGEIVEDLVNQYASFINHVWINYPEAVRWMKMEKYFSQPLAH